MVAYAQWGWHTASAMCNLYWITINQVAMVDRPLADPDAAARKVVEIANDVEAVQNGRIYIERAIALGWLWRHESGTYLRFTDAGAALFA
jgi:hypothetical protein